MENAILVKITPAEINTLKKALKDPNKKELLLDVLASIFFVITDRTRLDLLTSLKNVYFTTNYDYAYAREMCEILNYFTTSNNYAFVINIDNGIQINTRVKKNDPNFNEYKKFADKIFECFKNKTPSEKCLTEIEPETQTTNLEYMDQWIKKNYNINTLTVYNTTTRHYIKGMFRNKNLYTNDLFYHYICFIIDVLQRITLNRNITYMMSNLILNMQCNKDVYKGIWNNLSVCDVLKKMNIIAKTGVHAAIDTQETNDNFNTDSPQTNVGALIYAQQVIRENTSASNTEPNEDSPVEQTITIQFINNFEDDDELKTFLENYKPSEEIKTYVNGIIGVKTGRTGNMRLSRVIRPRTWTFRRTLDPRMDLRGGRRAKARTRHLKPRTRRRKR